MRTLDIPIETIDSDEIAYNLDIAYLESIGTDDWNLTPRMLIKNFETEVLHADRVRKANTLYPLELYFFRDKRIILDGVHRYTNLMMS